MLPLRALQHVAHRPRQHCRVAAAELQRQGAVFRTPATASSLSDASTAIQLWWGSLVR